MTVAVSYADAKLVHEVLQNTGMKTRDAYPFTLRICNNVNGTTDLNGSKINRLSRSLAMSIHVLLQVCVQILEHQVKHWLVELFNVFNFQQPGRIGVNAWDSTTTRLAPAISFLHAPNNVDARRKHLKQGHFAQGGWRDSFLFHLQSGLLQRHNLPGAVASRLVNLTVGALSYLLNLLVILHGDWLKLHTLCKWCGNGGGWDYTQSLQLPGAAWWRTAAD